jgi:hypothetical protein
MLRPFLLTSDFVIQTFARQQSQPTGPVIVKIVEPKRDPTGLADLLIGALGLTGILTLVAVIAAAVFGAVLFWMRSRKPFDH